MKNQKNDPACEHSGPTVSKADPEKYMHGIERFSASKKYENTDEKEIWEEFKKSNEAAFTHIYITYYGELVNFGLQFTSDKTLIEDIIQNLFIHLRNRGVSLPKLKSSIRLYLFQCFKRKFFDHQKANKYILPGKLDIPFEIVLAEDTRMIMDQNYQEQIEKLKHSITKLNTRQREIIYYYYYKNFTYEEIKILMGFGNVKSVRNFVYKTIAVLKKFVVLLMLLYLE